jgi:hypothetical protein
VAPVTTTWAIGAFDAVIGSIGGGDTIVVDTTAAAVFAVNGGNPAQVLVTDLIGGAVEGTLTFASGVLAAGAVAGTGGSLVDQVSCFARGTRIGTETGLVAVEDLAVGDRVRTADGGHEPVVWVGSRAVDCARHPKPETVWPVRVRAGAFGDMVPGRDLWLSPDHAVFVGGVLVPVKLLVNGTSIEQVKRSHVVYYHVELPEHAVILAEGLTVESYLDIGDRTDFEGGGTIRLFPDFAAHLVPDAAGMWETLGAMPLVMTGPSLAMARRMAGINELPASSGTDRIILTCQPIEQHVGGIVPKLPHRTRPPTVSVDR